LYGQRQIIELWRDDEFVEVINIDDNYDFDLQKMIFFKDMPDRPDTIKLRDNDVVRLRCFYDTMAFEVPSHQSFESDVSYQAYLDKTLKQTRVRVGPNSVPTLLSHLGGAPAYMEGQRDRNITDGEFQVQGIVEDVDSEDGMFTIGQGWDVVDESTDPDDPDAWTEFTFQHATITAGFGTMDEMCLILVMLGPTENIRSNNFFSNGLSKVPQFDPEPPKPSELRTVID